MHKICAMSVAMLLAIACSDSTEGPYTPPPPGDTNNAGGDTAAGDPLTGDPLTGDPLTGDPLAGDPLAGDPLTGDPLAGDPLAGDPLTGDPLSGDPLTGDPLTGDPVTGDPLTGDPLTGDPLTGDPLTGDPLTGDPGVVSCANTIAEVRAAPAGDIDLTFCNAVVTYVFEAGYYLQAGATGPAIRVYEGYGWTADVSVGDVITMRVTGVADFHGTRQITIHEPAVIQASAPDVSWLLQDLNTGDVVPNEDLESELIAVTATVTSINGRYVRISYGAANDVVLYTPDSWPLCVGATFDVIAPITQFDSFYQIEVSNLADVTDVNVSGCAGGGGRAPAAGELLINEFLADPPPGGDANCDSNGSTSEDEFIEIVNISATTLNLSGVTISDSLEVRHTFHVNTELAAYRAIVVFGGGGPACAWVVTQAVLASRGSLALNNSGDTITLADNGGATLVSYTYSGIGNIDQSLTLVPDLNDTDATATGIDGFVAHTCAGESSPGACDGSVLFSPGFLVDGATEFE